MKKLEEMISAHAYEQIKNRMKKELGEDLMKLVFPTIKRVLEGEGIRIKEEIIDWLDIESFRVCTNCGALMEEGWYMSEAGYACSDECAAEMEGITMEQFEKWRIYKDDIERFLEEEGKGRKIEDLTKEECDEIIDEYCADCDYFWTEWY